MTYTMLTRTVAPAEPAVSLFEAKEHLRVDGSDEDGLIQGLINAAVRAVEEETGKALVTQTWALKMRGPAGKVCLPLAPVQSISSMTYFDNDDASQSLTVGDFYLYSDNDRAWLEPKDNVNWPSMKDRDDALTITFVAGYGAASAVEQEIKQAILLLIGHWYEHRTAADKRMENLPLAYDYLTAQHKVGWVG